MPAFGSESYRSRDRCEREVKKRDQVGSIRVWSVVQVWSSKYGAVESGLCTDEAIPKLIYIPALTANPLRHPFFFFFFFSCFYLKKFHIVLDPGQWKQRGGLNDRDRASLDS